MSKLFYNHNGGTGAHIIDDGEDEIAEVFSTAISDDEAARLATMFVASETMLAALKSVSEWCDLIEQNYPEMTFTKLVRNAVAMASNTEVEPVKNYTVVGRAYNDDEVSTRIYNFCTRSDAIAEFTKVIAPDGASDMAKHLEGEDFDGVFIDAVIESETPMDIQ